MNGQNAERLTALRDSLKSTTDTTRIDLLFRMGKTFSHYNADSAFLYFEQSSEAAEMAALEKDYLRAQLNWIRIHYSQGDLEVASSRLDDMLDYCRQRDLSIEEAQFKSLQCVPLEKNGLHEESIDIQRGALRTYIEGSRWDLVAQAHTNIAVQFIYLRQLDSAMLHIDEAVRYKEDLGQIQKAIPDLGNIAVMLMHAGDFEKASQYLDRAWSLLDTSDFRLHIWLTTQNGIFYRDKGQLDSAIFFAAKAWKMVSKNPSLPYHTCHANMLYSNLLVETKKVDSALVVAQRGLETAVAHANHQILSAMHIRLAEAYMAKGVFDKADYHLTQGEQEARRFRNTENLKWAIAVRPKLLEKQGFYKQALEAYKLEATLTDSLAFEEKNQRILALERRYENAQLAEQVAIQELELTKKEAAERKMIFIGFALLLILAGLAWWLISKRRLQEQQRQLELEDRNRKVRQLEELSEMKSNFFTNISHELRTPLSLILAPIDDAVISEKRDHKKEVSLPIKQAGMIQRNAKRLTTLVDQILDLSKLDSGEMKAYVQEGEVARFIQILFISFESLAASRGIEMMFSSTHEDVLGFFDPDKLEKIITNIISNAIKHTPEGGRVSLQVSNANGLLDIRIEDQGRGMTDTEVQRIFDRYYQAGNLDGTGVGLTLVKELVDLCAGTIDVESELGKGSIFKIELPIEKSILERSSQIVFVEGELAQAPLQSLSWMLPKDEDYMLSNTNLDDEIESILLVEDNSELLQYISSILSNEYRIYQASNGRVGYDLAVEYSPALIISDVMMPEMNGIELCQKVKSNPKISHIPVILLTAKVGQEAKMEGLTAGADEYIIKPFQPEEMRIRVRNMMDQMRAMKRKYNLESHLKPEHIEVDSLEAQFLARIKEVVSAHMGDENFSVEVLAKEVGFSRSQLHRKMKALIDVGPNEFIRNYRLVRARDLLQQKAATVSEVAYKVGFSNLSYFTKMYKHHFGVLPSETNNES